MSPQTTRPPSSLARTLGPTGLLGLAWTAAPAVCGTLLLDVIASGASRREAIST